MQPYITKYFLLIFDQYAFGAVHPLSGAPIRKRTILISNSPRILEAMDRHCSCTVPHGQLIGGSHTTGPMECYPRQLCITLAGAIMPVTIGQKQVSTKEQEKAYEDFWHKVETESVVTEAMHVTDFTKEDPNDHLEVLEDYEQRFAFVNTSSNVGSGKLNKILPLGKEAVMRRLLRVHQNLGHPTNATMQNVMKQAGLPDELIKMASNIRCQICDSAALPRPGRQATPKAATEVNACLQMDNVEWTSPTSKQKGLFTVFMDEASRFPRVHCHRCVGLNKELGNVNFDEMRECLESVWL